MYTIGGPCDPNNDQACTPVNKFGMTPGNQTLRCGSTSILASRKPDNDSYNRLAKNPYANDSDVVRLWSQKLLVVHDSRPVLWQVRRWCVALVKLIGLNPAKMWVDHRPESFGRVAVLLDQNMRNA